MPRVLSPLPACSGLPTTPPGSDTYRRLMGGDLTDNGARAGQIRDQLLALTNARPADCSHPTGRPRPPARRCSSVCCGRWIAPPTSPLRRSPAVRCRLGARAATNSVGYRLVRAFRGQVRDLLFAPCRSAAGRVRSVPLSARPSRRRRGGPPRATAAAPAPVPFTTYDELLIAAPQGARRVAARSSLAECTWGDANRVRSTPLRHGDPSPQPLAGSPVRQLPATTTCRASRAGPSAPPAACRVARTRGRRIFHMPGGQSGHFLSRSMPRAIATGRKAALAAPAGSGAAPAGLAPRGQSAHDAQVTCRCLAGRHEVPLPRSRRRQSALSHAVKLPGGAD